MTLKEALKEQKQSKYHNQKIEIDGQKFDSKHEANRWIELKYMERVGLITDLYRQFPFKLLPGQRRNGKQVERPIYYYADFVYTQNGELVVEDAKGVKTDVYKIKKKLMLYFFNIRIKEV